MATSDGRSSGAERRQHRRVETDKRVSFLHGGIWQNCRIENVSQGGAAITSDHRPHIDKEIIVHIDELGLFKCRVLRHRDDGFAVRFEAADFDLDPELMRPRGERLEPVEV